MKAKWAVLVVDDEPGSTNVLRISLARHYPVVTAASGDEALARLAEHPEIAVAIIDQRMPGMTGTELIRRTIEPYPNLIRIILTGYTDIDSLIEAINAGRVYRYLTKPWSKDELLAVVRQGMEMYQLGVDNRRLQEELRGAYDRLRIEHGHLKSEVRGHEAFSAIVGSSAAVQSTVELARHAAANECNVLILGETGVGKELVARGIHRAGPRADCPFVSENCGAIAPDLLTSELFGHRKGSFTGAAEDRVGLFEVANGGTLFLDEIGDCPPELQTRLLRVLDQGEIRRVGDSQARPVDVRILAATHHDLEEDVRRGSFREDLFYRLNVLTIRVPPLRERRDDIPILAQRFLDSFNERKGKRVGGFSGDALEALGRYPFPGNVRELENEVERAHALTAMGDSIEARSFSHRLQASADDSVPTAGRLRELMDEHEVRLLREALARNNGNRTRTAEELGLSRGGLLQKLNRFDIR